LVRRVKAETEDDSNSWFVSVDVHHDHELVAYAVEARLLGIAERSSALQCLSLITSQKKRQSMLAKGLRELREQPLKGYGSAGREVARVVDRYVLRSEGNPNDPSFLTSFYDAFDPGALTELLESSLFKSLNAAGPSRSKPEALLRGRAAASMLYGYSDRAGKIGGDLDVVPPRNLPGRALSLREQVQRVVQDMMILVVLPPASGGVAAVRHLAIIGEIALDEVGRELLGDVNADGDETADEELRPRFPPPCGWRAARVLTRVGQVLQYRAPQADIPASEDIWGVERTKQLQRLADDLLESVFAIDPPILYRSRSLPIEASRYLLLDGERGRAHTDELVRRAVEGTTHRDSPRRTPFAESGAIPPRERMFSAYVAWERDTVKRWAERDGHRQYLHFDRTHPLSLIAELEHAAVQSRAPKRHHGASEVFLAGQQALDYTAAYLAQLEERGRHPTLGELYGTGSPEALFIRDALRCSADGAGKGWGRASTWPTDDRASDHVSRILASVPRHARHATRSVVAQALLTIDGAARRSAIEALRQAGLRDQAAELFAHVIREYVVREDDGGVAPWLLDVALFCLAHTGSFVGMSTLMRHAGLDGTEGDRSLTGPKGWLRVTALMGIGDLAEPLHDAEPHDGSAPALSLTNKLLSGVERRLDELAPDLNSADALEARWTGGACWDGYASEGLRFRPFATELRALAYVLAMLRSPDRRSMRMLWVLSGRYYDEGGGPQVLTTKENADGSRTYDLDSDKGWGEWIGRRGHLTTTIADLATWQLGEWGLDRIKVRFVDAPSHGGVRLVDPRRSASRAENRLRRLSAK
jgi:hypothetical protein